LPLLTALSQDQEVHVRECVVDSEALLYLLDKNNVTDGLTLLTSLSHDPEPSVRQRIAASDALANIVARSNMSEGLAVLVNLSRDEDAGVRQHVAESDALSDMVKLDWSKAFPELERLSQDTNASVRGHVARSKALASMCWGNASAAAALLTALGQDENESVLLEVATCDALVALVRANVTKAMPLMHHLIEDNMSSKVKASFENSVAFNALIQDIWIASSLLDVMSESAFMHEKINRTGQISCHSNMDDLGRHLDNHYGLLTEYAYARVCADTIDRETNLKESWPMLRGHLRPKNPVVRIVLLMKCSTLERIVQAEPVEDVLQSFNQFFEDEPQVKVAFSKSEAFRHLREKVDASTNCSDLEDWANRFGFIEDCAFRRLATLRAGAAEEAIDRARRLLIFAVVSFALFIAFLVVSVAVWYFYPLLQEWKRERLVAKDAKLALTAAKELEASGVRTQLPVTPVPPAHMDVFHCFQHVYSSPYILHKFNQLKPVLSSAIRISDEMVKTGLSVWDFSVLTGSGHDGSQESAAKNYQMARTFIEERQSGDLKRLMTLCGTISSSLDEYCSNIDVKERDPVEKYFDMYVQSFTAKRVLFDAMISGIAKATKAEAHYGSEKGMLRLAEKNALRPEAGLIWDPVRAMLVGQDVKVLHQVLESLVTEREQGRIKIVGINNRFARPTPDNWQDIAVYIMFTDERCNGIVEEIQIVHDAFLAIRTKFKAHDVYDTARFPAECLKLKTKVEVRGLPDSQSSSAG